MLRPTRLSPGRRRRFLMLAAVVLVLGSALVYLTVALERKREIDELQAMGDTLAMLRSGTESCRSALARRESAFRRFDYLVDSLRARVAEYEGLHPEGVPQRQYEAYMAVFERYNESVREWERRADSLRADEAACRATVERHNALADSLRRRVDARAGSG